MKDIHQKIYLLNRGQGFSKLTELGMVDHIFFTQRQTGKDTVLFSFQTKIFFGVDYGN